MIEVRPQLKVLYCEYYLGVLGQFSSSPVSSQTSETFKKIFTAQCTITSFLNENSVTLKQSRALALCFIPPTSEHNF